MKNKINPKRVAEQAQEGLVKGFFWAIGLSLGFAFVSVVLLAFLNRFMTVPVIGSFVADIVEATNAALDTRAPIR